MTNATRRRKDIPAGCWQTAVMAIATLALLILPGCGAVQTVAEPIDKTGCQWDCRQKGMEFHAYDYAHHACECEDADGVVIEIYWLIEE